MGKFDWKETLGFSVGLYLVLLLTLPFLGPMIGLSISGMSFSSIFSSIFTLNTLLIIIYLGVGYLIVKWILLKLKIINN